MEDNAEENTAEKEAPEAAAVGMDVGTPSNPINLDTEGQE